MRQRFEGAAATGIVAVLVSAVLIALTGTGAVLARSGWAASPRADDVAALLVGSSWREEAPPGHPLKVRIPAIEVETPLVALGIGADGTLEVPRFEEAGWYSEGTRPGDPGPAVIAAHLDSTSGPTVFYRLDELEPDDLVHVDYRDGTVTFAVREAATFSKSAFPTSRVYGSTPRPELRFVTCDGTFDRSVRSYRENLIVWADALAPA